MGKKTERALAGRVIWVTRPAHLSAELCRLIEADGGRAVQLPVIDIQPVRQPASRSKIESLLEEADTVIFVSRNAVRHAATSLPAFYDRIRGKVILAVGAGTRSELEQNGLTGILSTTSSTGSEALLQLAQLQPDNLSGRRILIVRGVGGRELLEQSLRQSGAVVACLEVYQRGTPDLDHDIVTRLWSADPPDAMIITSVEGLRNLVKMTVADRQAELLRTPLAVMSVRIGAAADTLGFTNRKAVAADASDAGLLQATRKIFES